MGGPMRGHLKVGGPLRVRLLLYTGAPCVLILFVLFVVCVVLLLQQNACTVIVEGRVNVCFYKKETVSFSIPQLHIQGLLWGPRVFFWEGPLIVEGPHMRCTLSLAGDTLKGAPQGGPPRDEVFGLVLPGGSQQEGDKEKGGPQQEGDKETGGPQQEGDKETGGPQQEGDRETGGPPQGGDKETEGPKGPPKPLAIITGSYTDRLYWNDEE